MSVVPRLHARLKMYEADREKRRPEILEAIEQNAGNISGAANMLGISRQWMTVLVHDLGLMEIARKLRRAAGQRSR